MHAFPILPSTTIRYLPFSSAFAAIFPLSGLNTGSPDHIKIRLPWFPVHSNRIPVVVFYDCGNPVAVRAEHRGENSVSECLLPKQSHQPLSSICRMRELRPLLFSCRQDCISGPIPERNICPTEVSRLSANVQPLPVFTGAITSPVCALKTGSQTQRKCLLPLNAVYRNREFHGPSFTPAAVLPLSGLKMIPHMLRKFAFQGFPSTATVRTFAA